MKNKAYTLAEIATLTHSILLGDPNHLISNVSDLENATLDTASFLSNPSYLQAMKKSLAGVIFVTPDVEKQPNRNYLVNQNPSRAFQTLIDLFYPQREPSGFFGVHPSAVVHSTAIIAEDVTIAPGAVIDEGVRIGKGTYIGPGVCIGRDCTIGEDCLIHPRVVIRENCVVGNRVIIQPGAVIGSCGFGYITENGRHVKLNQVGGVRIHDDVEIGANTTIDRGRFQDTVIGEGTKIDNLVQVGHGVKVGAHNIFIAQTGIAGSTTTGRYVILAGQVAVAGHIHLGDGVTVAGKSGVSKSLTAGKYGGIPAVKLETYNRNQVFLRNIEKYVNQIESIEARLKELERQ